MTGITVMQLLRVGYTPQGALNPNICGEKRWQPAASCSRRTDNKEDNAGPYPLWLQLEFKDE